MLPAANRMHRSRDFAAVVRAGARARGTRVVVHQRLDLGTGAPLVGFIVNRAVGGSVARHQVARRLRAQIAHRLGALPAGSGTVVRALPTAGSASSAELGTSLDQALSRLAGRR